MTLACAFCVRIASSGGWCALREVVECVADMDEDNALEELLDAILWVMFVEERRVENFVVG